VVDSFLVVVEGGQHQVFEEALHLSLSQHLLFLLNGLPEDGGDDIDHRVVGTLSGCGDPLGRVSDDTESGLVSGDVDLFNCGSVFFFKDRATVLEEELEEAVDSAS
jgi:hypothetical protein